MKFPPKKISRAIYPLGTTVKVPRIRGQALVGLIIECKLQANGRPLYRIENVGLFAHITVVLVAEATEASLKEVAAAIHCNTDRSPF